MSELTVAVTYKRGKDNRSYFDIKFPEDQKIIDIKTSTKILIGGIALLIKAGHNEGSFKDYEMMEEIIKYLNHEFISIDSFDDYFINPKKIVK
jgi:hypothetical protein